jgi:hypothetical protein
MHPDIHLSLERIRAADLEERARRWRLTPNRPTWARTAGDRLGWALVETGLRLVHRSDFQEI